MLASFVKLSLLSLAFPLNALAGSHGNLLNRHHDVAKRQSANVSHLERRFSDARLSFYDVETGNAGSCGQFHQNSDFTVAMNAAQMNSGFCFKTISISYGGKTTTATVSDTCPGCPYGGLDLTEGLFSFFAPQSVGILYGTWEFTDGSGGGAASAPPVSTKKTTTWEAPTPIWTPPPVTTHKTTSKTPTSTWTPPPSTTTWSSSTTSTTSTSKSKASSSSWSSTSSSKASTSSTTSSSTIDYLTGPASGLAIPTGSFTPPTDSTQNVAQMYQGFVQLGGLIAGAGAV